MKNNARIYHLPHLDECMELHASPPGRKRYIVFGYEEYYPRGAKQDEIGREDSVLDCIRIMKDYKEKIFKESNGYSVCYVYYLDMDTGEWINL